MSDLQERLAVVRAFSAFTMTAEGRARIAKTSFTSGMPAVAVLYDDSIDSVEKRLREHPGQTCLVMMIHNGMFTSRFFIPTAIPVGAATEVSRYSSIGMLFEAMKSMKKTEVMAFTDTHVGSMATAPGLRASVAV